MALLCLIALVAYPILWSRAPLHTGDSPQYLAVARDLADLRLETLHDRSIGYPLLLAVADLTPYPPRTTFILSLVLHVATVWLLGALLHSVSEHRHGVLLFGGVLLLPPFVEPAGYVMTENLAQFALALGLTSLCAWLSTERRWLLVVASVAFAWSAVTKPAYLALTFALAATLALLRRTHRGRLPSVRLDVRAGIILVSASVLLVGGISWANHRAFGYFGMVPMTGYHLSTRTMNLWERLPEEHAQVRDILLRARDVERTRRGGTHSGTQTIWQARTELLSATGMSNQDLSRYLVAMNLDLIRRAPVEYFEEVAQSMALYWFPPAGELATMNRTDLRVSWALLHVVIVMLFFLQLVVFIGHAMFLWSRRVLGLNVESWRGCVSPALSVYVLAGAIVFYTMIVSCMMDIGEVRQRRATDAFIVLMVFVGMQVWWGGARCTTLEQESASGAGRCRSEPGCADS